MNSRIHRRQYPSLPTATLLSAAILIASLMFRTCSRPVSPRFSFETVYVDSLFVPAGPVAAGTPVTIRIKGSMPDPSWAFDHFLLQTNGLSLTIEPVGRRDLNAGIVPQVLVAYDESLSYIFNQPGLWTVIAAGRVNTLEERINIGPWTF